MGLELTWYKLIAGGVDGIVKVKPLFFYYEVCDCVYVDYPALFGRRQDPPIVMVLHVIAYLKVFPLELK